MPFDFEKSTWVMSDQIDATPMTDDSADRALINSVNEYNMDHTERGLALIINNVGFKNLSKRDGSDNDAEMMYSLFETLGFEEIIMEYDLTVEAMKQCLKSVVLEKHSSRDCFACVILSHGKDGCVFGSDDKTVTIKELTEFVQGENCASLVGKPKLFFIQACQGHKFDSGVDAQFDSGVDAHDGESGESVPEISQTVDIIPTDADLLIAHSTLPGYYAWINQQHGSWFIQSLAEIIGKQWQDQDLLAMMTRVSNKVALDYESNNPTMKYKKQMPCFTSTLTKDLFFSQKK